MTILCSACLLGFKCRYDGESRPLSSLEFFRNQEVVPFCPEVAAGLTVPRLAGDLHGGDGHKVLDGQAQVINQNGEDVTDYFIKGAQLAIEAVNRYGITMALLKEKSPSCGVNTIRINGIENHGNGVTTAMLQRAGIMIFSEIEINAVASITRKTI